MTHWHTVVHAELSEENGRRDEETLVRCVFLCFHNCREVTDRCTPTLLRGGSGGCIHVGMYGGQGEV